MSFHGKHNGIPCQTQHCALPIDYVHPGPYPGTGPGFARDGYAWVGENGRAEHVGPPLTRAEVRALPDGAEIVITWFGGNGPHAYRVLVDEHGGRRTEGLYCDHIPNFSGDRITLGWTDATRAVVAERVPEPEHIRARWAALRGG